MILSVGYQRHSQDSLVQLLDELAIVRVVDVRARPISRHKGMGRRQLATRLGARYEWHGDTLGGRYRGSGGPTRAGLDWLAGEVASELEHTCLLCLEECPGDCHRHHLIAVPLLARDVDVLHVYRDQLVGTLDLQQSIERSSDYEYVRLRDFHAMVAEMAESGD